MLLKSTKNDGIQIRLKGPDWISVNCTPNESNSNYDTADSESEYKKNNLDVIKTLLKGVEGARPDLRVINYSLLGTDWYVNQLRYKLNQSAPADVIFTPEQIQGSNRDIVPVYELPGIDKNAYYDLYTMLKDVVGSEDQSKMVGMQSGDMSNVFPSRKVSIAVDVEGVRKNYNLKSTGMSNFLVISILSKKRFFNK